MNLDRSAMRIDHLLRDSKPESGAAFLRRVEWIEDLAELVVGDSATVVADSDSCHPIAVVLNRELDPALVLSRFHRVDRVVDHVREKQSQFLGVSPNGGN